MTKSCLLSIVYSASFDSTGQVAQGMVMVIVSLHLLLARLHFFETVGWNPFSEENSVLPNVECICKCQE